MQLPQFVRDLLASPPRAGDGVHRWIFCVARQLHAYREKNEIADLIAAALYGCGRAVSTKEIHDAIENSRACAWRPGLGSVPPSRQSEAAWPPRNVEAIAGLVAAGNAPAGLADLVEASPIRFDDAGEGEITEAIIDRLFPPESLLCCGTNAAQFDTRLRAKWRGQLSQLQFIVPSPMTARFGKKLNPQPGEDPMSAHTRNNTGPRRFLITEFDNGTIPEQCAALWELDQYLPLVLVLHSGGKSLHGWFYCHGESEDALLRFMRYAVGLGGDPRLWLREQFVRMPEGLRPGPPPCRQPVFYFAPEVVK